MKLLIFWNETKKKQQRTDKNRVYVFVAVEAIAIVYDQKCIVKRSRW